MTALNTLGNRAEALGVYEGLCRRLRDDLGVPPSEATRALHTALLERP